MNIGRADATTPVGALRNESLQRCFWSCPNQAAVPTISHIKASASESFSESWELLLPDSATVQPAKYTPPSHKTKFWVKVLCTCASDWQNSNNILSLSCKGVWKLSFYYSMSYTWEEVWNGYWMTLSQHIGHLVKNTPSLNNKTFSLLEDRVENI